MRIHQFKVSAPGKVILFGEHAVVYNKLAVAASLDQRMTLEFAELPDEVAESRQMYHEPYDYDNLYRLVREFVPTIINRATTEQIQSLEAFFFTMVFVNRNRTVLKPFRVHLDTEFPIGSGLGSSASFVVCFVTCFYYWWKLRKGEARKFIPYDLRHIADMSQMCEKVMHGNPSGIDTSVCTFGSIVKFRSNPYIMEPMAKAPKLKILLVDTQVQRSTKTMVQKVKELQAKHPTIYEPFIASIDGISDAAFQALVPIFRLSDNCEILLKYKELMKLINMNQNILSMLEVSHPALDKICDEAQKHGLAAKLTGAGGGGHAYVLIPPDTSDETISNLSQKLTAEGFKVTPAELGGNGVRVEDV
ncbi:mevalonate kinase isoform X3 [Harpegnathos saltator]|uniref:mevalonate kinase isoform X3 n=1 Tax=Harpegnathos saltator TaxID=610380 RepID=UPI000DBEEDD5|nr:mevalonate kinase isoform X3 [Harpegnathos saltator]